MVVHTWQTLREVNLRGETRKVRNITVVDATQFALEVAFWGDDAEAIQEEALQGHQVISFSNIQVTERPDPCHQASQIRESRGRTGTATRGSEVSWNVSTKEAVELKKWYLEVGKPL